MIKSNFFSTIKKKIDKLDTDTLRNLLFEVVEENRNFKTVFNSMKEGVLVVNDKTHVIFYNKMAVQLLELKGKSLINTPLSSVINNDYFCTLIFSAIDKEEQISDVEVYIDGDFPRYVSCSVQPLVKEGKIIGNIIILDDITIEKENKNKLRQAESLAALTSISAGIAHEIKNPLAAMSIHVQLIEDEVQQSKTDLSNDFQFSVNVLKEEITRLNNIVMDYLMTVRPLKAELIPVNLTNFLSNFCDFIVYELESKDIRLIKDFDDLPEVWLDEKYFKQALLNLVKNSIASTDPGGIIEIRAYKKHNYIYVEIIDNGCGIPKEVQTKIFDPYFTTKNFGTGLGLTIVYKIIKEHKGEISFSSKEGETVFTLKLPLSYIEDGLIEYSGDEH